MLLRKLFRTARLYKAQFISMIIMVAIGIGVFVGFNMEWYSLQKDTASFFEQTNYADYRIMSEQGFSKEDISAIENIEGVKAATRVLSVNVDVKNENKSLALFAQETYNVSTIYVTSGKDYDKESDGFWLSDKYATKNGINIGDALTIVYRNIEISGEVIGLVKSGEFMVCVADENQIMPDYSSFGFVYVSPEKVKTALGGVEFYPQINILSDMEKTEMEQAVKKALNKTTLVLSKSEHTSYAGVQGEIEEGQTMTAVLPVLFLLIGVLTMITTMHRITANEKTQIGTLKALGFKNKRILIHYTSYGLFIGIIGAILGVILGIGICSIVINPNGMMATYVDLPNWGLHIKWWTWILIIGVIIFLAFISFLSVKSKLKGTASDALRPYVPKKVKPLMLEKTKAWNKMSFATKWNLRDIFRNKTRSLMTLVGVLGCMVLLVGGLGMRDTMTNFQDTISNRILNYSTRVNFVENATNERVREFIKEYDADYVSISSVQVNGEPLTLEIYDINHDSVRFLGEDGKTKKLSNEGAYICMRIADRGYSKGDIIEFSPYGSDKTYFVKVAGILRSLQSESITMTADYANNIGISYNISSAFLNISQNDIKSADFISGTQTKSAIIDSYANFIGIMDTMVLIFVFAAVVLGVVVLYNLGVMSYVERYRELATLKVVGFNNKRVSFILISQNIWLTIIGIVIGLPMGAGVLQLLINTLASEYELKMVLGVLTYSVSILLTFGVSLVVGLFIAKKNKKINMVEALKNAE